MSPRNPQGILLVCILIILGTFGCRQESLVITHSTFTMEQLEEIFAAQELGGEPWKQVFNKFQLDKKENMNNYSIGLKNLKLDKDKYHTFLHKIYVEHIKHSKGTPEAKSASSK